MYQHRTDARGSQAVMYSIFFSGVLRKIDLISEPINLQHVLVLAFHPSMHKTDAGCIQAHFLAENKKDLLATFRGNRRSVAE